MNRNAVPVVPTGVRKASPAKAGILGLVIVALGTLSLLPAEATAQEFVGTELALPTNASYVSQDLNSSLDLAVAAFINPVMKAGILFQDGTLKIYQGSLDWTWRLSDVLPAGYSLALIEDVQSGQMKVMKSDGSEHQLSPTGKKRAMTKLGVVAGHTGSGSTRQAWLWYPLGPSINLHSIIVGHDSSIAYSWATEVFSDSALGTEIVVGWAFTTTGNYRFMYEVETDSYTDLDSVNIRLRFANIHNALTMEQNKIVLVCKDNQAPFLYDISTGTEQNLYPPAGFDYFLGDQQAGIFEGRIVIVRGIWQNGCLGPSCESVGRWILSRTADGKFEPFGPPSDIFANTRFDVQPSNLAYVGITRIDTATGCFAVTADNGTAYGQKYRPYLVCPGPDYPEAPRAQSAG
ncbi:MAG: hypothetical protein KDD66_04495 [Bdellovibrionales bacterium]|nr:hypothetical protein [Bdellovibrionales bacterium]